MFQSYESVANPAQGISRTARLRAELEARGLDGFLVPRADEHQGEYVARRSERLQWLTGFTGSAGAALILRDRALLFVDGRYTLQARQQADPATFTIESLVENPPASWLRDNAARGWRIGFDPWLHTIADARALRAALEKQGAELVPVQENLVDAIWEDQPAAPAEPVEIHPDSLAGESARDKLARLAAAVAQAGADAAVLTDPSSLAWAFNIRGHDVPHTPLALGFAVIAAEGPHAVYMARRKLGREAAAYLTQLAELREPQALGGDLRARATAGGRVALDPQLAAERLRLLVEEAGGTVVEAPDPARLPRATKNAAELAGTRAAHRRDGAAVTRYLHWLDRQEPGSLDEIAAARRLEAMRAKIGQETQMPLRDVSFDTISGAGPNGAIIHYRVTTATNRKLKPGELYLVDSGAQYRDGTTDITRTVPIGAPDGEMRTHYTLVLKGMIGISLLRFPPGTRGMDIDAVARLALWKAGLDYAHGTGHGVGSYLSVHEGPQRIAKTGSEKLLPGMILSNEPGYYREGRYGVRLENLIVVTPAEPVADGDIAMHGFETLTLAPFDRRLIRAELLTAEERGWLDAYHARVLAEIGPMLDGEVLGWLEKMTAPL
ncbi:MAG: aminopeptidase P family protein [Rhizobiales bacterium]|nr:aminopeptidase P family protein [Hyphomicrobiales bacterium]